MVAIESKFGARTQAPIILLTFDGRLALSIEPIDAISTSKHIAILKRIWEIIAPYVKNGNIPYKDGEWRDMAPFAQYTYKDGGWSVNYYGGGIDRAGAIFNLIRPALGSDVAKVLTSSRY